MFFNKVSNKSAKVSVLEAHILWRILKDRYVVIDYINQVRNFTHDQDFLLYLDRLIKEYKNDTKILINELNKYSINGPKPNARAQNTIGNSEEVRDAETAEIIFGFMRLDITLKISTLKDTYENQQIRNLIIRFIKNAMERIDSYIKYLKLKNWISEPPLYPYVNPECKEKIASNEVYLLWDHLVYRYFNIRQTKYFISYASDKDLKALFAVGLKILVNQATDLENKLLYFGVTLPAPFPETMPNTVNTEAVDDEYMFTAILRGMQNALALHGLALQEVIVNDNLRKYFRHYTYSEIEYIDKMIEYGKMKGWLFMPPNYRA